MDPIIGGSLISAGANILGGIFGRRSAKRADQFQRNFVQIRAEDARKAGIHPLAALGANGAYTPVGNPMGDALAQAGADIGAGVAAKQQAQMQNRIAESQIKVNEAQASALNAQATTLISDAKRFATGGPGKVNFGDPSSEPSDPASALEAAITADDDKQYSPEEVLGKAVARGELQEVIDEATAKNSSPEVMAFLRAWAAGLNPNSYIRAYRQITDKTLRELLFPQPPSGKKRTANVPPRAHYGNRERTGF